MFKLAFRSFAGGRGGGRRERKPNLQACCNPGMLDAKESLDSNLRKDDAVAPVPKS